MGIWGCCLGCFSRDDRVVPTIDPPIEVQQLQPGRPVTAIFVQPAPEQDAITNAPTHRLVGRPDSPTVLAGLGMPTADHHALLQRPSTRGAGILPPLDLPDPPDSPMSPSIFSPSFLPLPGQPMARRTNTSAPTLSPISSMRSNSPADVFTPDAASVVMATQISQLPEALRNAYSTWLNHAPLSAFEADPTLEETLAGRMNGCLQQNTALVVIDLGFHASNLSPEFLNALRAHGIVVPETLPDIGDLHVIPTFTPRYHATIVLLNVAASPWHVISFWQQLAKEHVDRTEENILRDVLSHQIRDPQLMAEIVRAWTSDIPGTFPEDMTGITASFTAWLAYLCETAEYNPLPQWVPEGMSPDAFAAQARQTYAERVMTILTTGVQEPGLCGHIRQFIHINMGACGDRRAVELDAIEVACSIAIAASQSDPLILARTLIGARRYDYVQKLAMQHAMKYLPVRDGIREDVELALLYTSRLRTRLGLPGKTLVRLFPLPEGCAFLESPQALQKIFDRVLKKSTSPRQLCSLLVQSPEWEAHLRKAHPNDFSAVDNDAAEQMTALEELKELPHSTLQKSPDEFSDASRHALWAVIGAASETRVPSHIAALKELDARLKPSERAPWWRAVRRPPPLSELMTDQAYNVLARDIIPPARLKAIQALMVTLTQAWIDSIPIRQLYPEVALRPTPVNPTDFLY